MNSNQYTDFNRIWDLRDINGNDPLVRIIEGNRTGGKTTWLNTRLVRRFKKYGEKFILCYQYKTNLKNIPKKFFSDISTLKKDLADDIMTEKTYDEEGYTELYLNDEICGYVLALNSCSNVKALSHMLNSCAILAYDEFQSESLKYPLLPADKLTSIIISAARGHNEVIRADFHVIMVSNNIDPLNPFYTALNISPDALYFGPNILRGEEWVLMKDYNEYTARELNKRIPFKTQALKSAADGEYLINRKNFIRPIKLNNASYINTLIYQNETFSMYIVEGGSLYFKEGGDAQFKKRFAVDPASMNPKLRVIPQNIRLYIIERFKLGEVSCSSTKAQNMLEFIVGYKR